MSNLHDERCAKLTQALSRANLDCVVLFGNAWQNDYLRYSTDFAIVEGDAFSVFNRDGSAHLFIESAAEAERARSECPHLEVAFAPDLVETVSTHLKRIGNLSVGQAPLSLMPMGLGNGHQLADATDLVDRCMYIKTPAEIDAIRRATRMAEDGYRVFMEAARPGRREYELVADVEAYFRLRGCPENFQILGSGGVEVMGMHPPSDRKLKAGDLVTTELTPCIDGYYAQICRTLVLGEPTQKQRAAFAVFVEAMEAGKAVLKPGVTAAQVAKAENDVFRAHGLGDYTTSKYTRVRGHGMGLFVDGVPAILEDVPTVLEENTTLIIHPNTYHPEVGYIVVGDTVAVTKTGCETLGSFPAELQSVPV
jgi:Xaa-Pro aminopeptidase